RAVADRIPFGQSLLVEASSGQPLFGGGPRVPLCQERINARGGGTHHGVTSRGGFHPAGNRYLEVFVDGRTTQAQVPSDLLDTEAFNQDFVTDDMNSLHAEHSFPPVAEVLAQPYRTEGPECSFSACQTVQFPISATNPPPQSGFLSLRALLSRAWDVLS